MKKISLFKKAFAFAGFTGLFLLSSFAFAGELSVTDSEVSLPLYDEIDQVEMNGAGDRVFVFGSSTFFGFDYDGQDLKYTNARSDFPLSLDFTVVSVGATDYLYDLADDTNQQSIVVYTGNDLHRKASTNLADNAIFADLQEVAVSDSGKYIFVADENAVHVFYFDTANLNFQDLQHVATFTSDDLGNGLEFNNITDIAVNAEGSVLAVADADRVYTLSFNVGTEELTSLSSFELDGDTVSDLRLDALGDNAFVLTEEVLLAMSVNTQPVSFEVVARLNDGEANFEVGSPGNLEVSADGTKLVVSSPQVNKVDYISFADLGQGLELNHLGTVDNANPDVDFDNLLALGANDDLSRVVTGDYVNNDSESVELYTFDFDGVDFDFVDYFDRDPFFEETFVRINALETNLAGDKVFMLDTESQTLFAYSYEGENLTSVDSFNFVEERLGGLADWANVVTNAAGNRVIVSGTAGLAEFYLFSYEGGELELIDFFDNFNVVFDIEDMEISSAGDRLFVLDYRFDGLGVFSFENDEISFIDSIDSDEEPRFEALNGSTYSNLEVSADGSRVFAFDQGRNKIYAFGYNGAELEDENALEFLAVFGENNDPNFNPNLVHYFSIDNTGENLFLADVLDPNIYHLAFDGETFSFVMEYENQNAFGFYDAAMNVAGNTLYLVAAGNFGNGVYAYSFENGELVFEDLISSNDNVALNVDELGTIVVNGVGDKVFVGSLSYGLGRKQVLAALNYDFDVEAENPVGGNPDNGGVVNNPPANNGGGGAGGSLLSGRSGGSGNVTLTDEEEVDTTSEVEDNEDTTETEQTSGMNFSDLVAGEWYYDYFVELYEAGVFEGYSDGTMRPGAQILRSEFSKIVAVDGGFKVSTSAVYPFPQNLSYFPDVQYSEWYGFYVNALFEANVVDGYGDGTFGPGRTLTRAEALKMIMEAKGVEVMTTHSGSGFSDVKDYAWYYDYVMTAAELGIVEGYSDGTFRPDAPVSRAEAAKLLVEVK